MIAEDTLRILKEGEYTTTRGASVSIREAVRESVAGSVHYTEALLHTIQAKLSGELALAGTVPTVFEVCEASTLEAALRLTNEGVADIFALNFASARNPGGGFLGGAQAQEESLARSSGLYLTLTEHFAMYETNRKFTSCLYTDQMIYSPGVPVFKDDDGALLDRFYRLSFITAPAVNAGVIRQNEPQRIDEIGPVMLARIDKVLSVALQHGHKTLLLGAWGCGVFKNEPADVAAYFAQHLLQGRYTNRFERVVFAVMAREDRFIAPFREHFAK